MTDFSPITYILYPDIPTPLTPINSSLCKLGVQMRCASLEHLVAKLCKKSIQFRSSQMPQQNHQETGLKILSADAYEVGEIESYLTTRLGQSTTPMHPGALLGSYLQLGIFNAPQQQTLLQCLWQVHGT